MEDLQTTDPTPHVQNIAGEIRSLIDHLRRDIDKVKDAKAAALFETSAEVLGGLEKAFTHFAKKSESAWKK